MTTKQLQKNSAKTPKLRFAGFSGAWEEKNLSGIGKTYNGLQGKSGEDFGEGEPFITYKQIFDSSEIDINQFAFVKITNGENQNKCQFGDVFFTTSSETPLEVGFASVLLNKNVSPYLNSFSFGFRFNSLNEYDPSFAKFFFRSFIYRKEVVKLAQGSTRYNISKTEFMKMKFAFPPLPEQTKIASFLELADGFIENLRMQKDALQEYKKGMMQKIFAQKIRFKDDNGKSFPKWEEKKLGEVLKERKEFSTKGKGYTHISLTTQGVVPKSERYDRDFLVGDDEVKGYKITRLNDLCYNPANLKFGVISINKLGAGIFSPIYVTFEIVGQNIDFVGYYLIRDAFINKARRYEQGTVYERMAVHPSDFVKVKVSFPSLPEQEKIANFLISIDKTIEVKQEQIARAGEWKKGLMQGLFI